jgi:hypothetical protein
LFIEELEGALSNCFTGISEKFYEVVNKIAEENNVKYTVNPKYAEKDPIQYEKDNEPLWTSIQFPSSIMNLEEKLGCVIDGAKTDFSRHENHTIRAKQINFTLMKGLSVEYNTGQAVFTSSEQEVMLLCFLRMLEQLSFNEINMQIEQITLVTKACLLQETVDIMNCSKNDVCVPATAEPHGKVEPRDDTQERLDTLEKLKIATEAELTAASDAARAFDDFNILERFNKIKLPI